MRGYTSLEQSKKLAEILPLESADMYYTLSEDNGMYMIGFGKPNKYPSGKIQICWSLAALLELLPKRIEIVDNVYELSIYLYGIYYWNINNGNLCFESKDKDNLVDACYEAIVFLHEQKLSL